MSLSSNKIKLSIIGKPNSGKSTLFNTLLGKYLSEVGDEYGLTKKLHEENLEYKKIHFILVDTPGLRRKSKVIEKDEILRNTSVINNINKVEIVLLLIDSLESITKQDFKLADLVISKNKILFFLFNKIDIIEDKQLFKKKITRFLKNNYSKSQMINVAFISAKNNLKIKDVLNQIISQKELINTNIPKNKLNKFLLFLSKEAKLPKVKNVQIKPKYIVQLSGKVPTFKIFINSKKKTPSLFQKYFENSFRKYFKLEGIPIVFKYIRSQNPYI